MPGACYIGTKIILLFKKRSKVTGYYVLHDRKAWILFQAICFQNSQSARIIHSLSDLVNVSKINR